MATDQLTYSGTLKIWKCWCGIRVGLPAELDRQIRLKASGAYCPLGHQFWLSGPTEAETERERRERAEARETAVRDQLQATERSNRALKGVVTRTKRRIGKGVCPCCNRHFANVERHMESKHPEYAEAT